MWLKPAEGLRVLRPDTFMPLAAEGEEVEVTDYWRRRLRDGDAVEGSAPAEAAVSDAALSAPEADARQLDQQHADEEHAA